MEAVEKTVVIVRHGQRGDVVHPSFRLDCPNTLDSSLTELGIYQSQRTKSLISCFTPPTNRTKLISSPFLGCIQTALQISDNPILDWRFADLLHILHYPVDITETITCKTDWFKQQMFEAEVRGTPPQYPEEYENMRERVKNAFEEYMAGDSFETLVIVTHLMPLEVISGLIKGENVKLMDQGFCAATIATWKEGKFETIVVADYTHAPQYIMNRNR
jgi:broad specificity phosphatase PhoE